MADIQGITPDYLRNTPPVDSKGAAIDKLLDDLIGEPWKRKEAKQAILAILAQEVNKAVLKAELKARTDTMRIYNKSFKEDGAKDG